MPSALIGANCKIRGKPTINSQTVMMKKVIPTRSNIQSDLKSRGNLTKVAPGPSNKRKMTIKLIKRERKMRRLRRVKRKRTMKRRDSLNRTK